MLPLGDIIKRHDLQFHMCADDYQLFYTIKKLKDAVQRVVRYDAMQGVVR